MPPNVKPAAAAAAPPSNVFVNYLPLDVDEESLRERFSKYGSIVSVRVIRHGIPSNGAASVADANVATRQSSDDVGARLNDKPPGSTAAPTAGKSKGYGFVLFSNPSEAAAARDNEDGTPFGNKKLAVSFAANAFDPVGDTAASEAPSSRQASRQFSAANDSAAPASPVLKRVNGTGVPNIPPHAVTDASCQTDAKAGSAGEVDPVARTEMVSRTTMTIAPAASEATDPCTLTVSPVSGPLGQLVQAISIFGEITSASLGGDNGSKTVTVRFTNAAHCASAARAFQSNSVFQLHPTAVLTAQIGSQPAAVPSSVPPSPASSHSAHIAAPASSSSLTRVASSLDVASAAAPAGESRRRGPGISVVPLQTTSATQFMPYQFPTSVGVRVGAPNNPAPFRAAAQQHQPYSPQLALLPPHTQQQFFDRPPTQCQHGPHCHCSDPRTANMMAASAMHMPRRFNVDSDTLQDYAAKVHDMATGNQLQSSGAKLRTSSSTEFDRLEGDHPAVTRSSMDPLAAAFSKNSKAYQQLRTTSDAAASPSSPVNAVPGSRSNAITSTYSAELGGHTMPPLPTATAAGYIDGYGTASAPLQRARDFVPQQPRLALEVAPPLAAAVPRNSTCSYCHGVTTVLLRNVPREDVACRRLVEEQLGQFGYIKFVECWGDGAAVAAFFQQGDAAVAVETLFQSEYEVQYFDCSSYHHVPNN